MATGAMGGQMPPNFAKIARDFFKIDKKLMVGGGGSGKSSEKKKWRA